MDFVGNHIQAIIKDGLLNKKSPEDISYMIMLKEMRETTDVVAIMFDNHVHMRSLEMHGKYTHKQKHMLRDFEINNTKKSENKGGPCQDVHLQNHLPDRSQGVQNRRNGRL